MTINPLHAELDAAIRDMTDAEVRRALVLLTEVRDDIAISAPKAAHFHAVLAVILRAERHRRQCEVKQLRRDFHAGPDRVVGWWGTGAVS